MKKSLSFILSLALLSLPTAWGKLTCIDELSLLQINSQTAEQNIADVLSITTSQTDIEIKLSGKIDKSSIAETIMKLRNAANSNRAFYKNITLKLDSIGGDINQAIKLFREIKNLTKNPDVSINTKVANRDDCDSACTIIFAAGEKRIAGRKAKFGFHSPDYIKGYGAGLSRKDIKAIEEEFRQKWLTAIAEADPVVAREIQERRLLYGSRMKYMRASELMTGYVTELV